MKKLEIAAESFILLSQITDLLFQGYDAGSELQYEIIPGRGYRINIVIEPPMEPIQISTPRDK